MDKLGINFIQIIAYTIIFFVLYLLAKRFVNKVLATTAERQKTIEEGLENAKQVEQLRAEKLKEIEAEKKEIIQEAYTHANEILEKSKTKEEHLLREAKEKANTLIIEAGKELSELRLKSKEEGLKDAKEIITLAIKKAFSTVHIDQSVEEKLIEESLSQLKK